MKKSFLVVYEKGRKNYSGFAPDVPGCGSLGKTLEDMRLNLTEALELYMDTAIELGLPLPEPVTSTVTLPIEGELDPKTTYVVEHLRVKVPSSWSTTRRPTHAKQTSKSRELQAA